MKSQIKRIIIPTDFTAQSESAFKTGIAIAKRQHAEVTILHVIDGFDNKDHSKLQGQLYQIEAEQFLSVGKYLDMLAAKIHNNTGIKISSKVLEGSPADKICSYAFQQKASLIVMGTHGISGSRELFMGSDAYKIIRTCSCPVLTVPGNWKKTNFGRVLFPVQLKPGTFEKYYYARPIIEKNNSEIIILGLSEKTKPREIKELAILVDKLKLQLHVDHVKFQSAFSPCSDFPGKVVQVADEFMADLAVIAVNLSDKAKPLIGETFAQQILEQLKIPVLNIKPFSQSANTDLQMELAGNWSKGIN